ncbi:MAG: hypothetical protein IPK88_16820 [Saprospiraceae bacterium]|nr:hypothetical protein [Candidatus Defluviibacterium haderslevense]
MEKMTQDWFEMTDLKKRYFDKMVWIPLFQSMDVKKGVFGFVDYTEEYFAFRTIAVPISQKVNAENLDWSDAEYFDNSDRARDNYSPGYIYRNKDYGIVGENLVTEGRGNTEVCSDWFLNPDLLVALGLKQEGDIWKAIDFGFDEVIKINRDEKGYVQEILIKAQYLKDYLSARGMALYICSYRSRKQILENVDHIKWNDESIKVFELDKWEGSVNTIHEGGHLFDSGFAVLNISRTDVDYKEDVPNLEFPSENSTKTSEYEGKFEGKKLFIIEGELWRREWIEPAEKSTIVLDEEIEPTAFFITDNSGKKESRKTLDDNTSRWLWFKPNIINAILGVRGSKLIWYTQDTGRVGFLSSQIHFGINSIGLINVLAVDMARLPDWQQNIWVGYNISPEGGVSAELLMSQMEARPAQTLPPEAYLHKATECVNEFLFKLYGIKVFKEYSDVTTLIGRIHRFRVNDKNSLFQLAKDIYLFIGERIDTAQIKKIVKPTKEEKWGQLISLEKLLSLKIDPQTAHDLLSPLWGIYTLRISDAHLASDDLSDAYKNCNLDETQPFVIQARQLIYCATDSLYNICFTLENIK